MVPLNKPWEIRNQHKRKCDWHFCLFQIGHLCYLENWLESPLRLPTTLLDHTPWKRYYGELGKPTQVATYANAQKPLTGIKTPGGSFLISLVSIFSFTSPILCCFLPAFVLLHLLFLNQGKERERKGTFNSHPLLRQGVSKY